MAYVWPYRLLTPATAVWLPSGQVIAGPPSIDGQQQTAATDGGGRWTATLGGIQVWTDDQIRAARAWSSYLQRGARTCVVPNFDLLRAPRPLAGGQPLPPSSPAPAAEGDYFGWEPGFGSALMVATTVGAALLRATAITIQAGRGCAALKPGMHFSLQHPTKDWRLYRIERVTGVAGGNQYACMIWPPLREATTNAMPVELDVPRCLMRVQMDKADALEPVLDLDWHASIDANFVEAS